MARGKVSGAERLDIHDRITQSIITQIEKGRAEQSLGSWQMPWHRPGSIFTIPKNALTGNDYTGVNILSLWMDADDKKFERQIWATYKQWEELGAQVRKGEKGSLIVKYGEFIPKNPTSPPKATPRAGNPRAAKGGTSSPTTGPDEPSKLVYAKPAWVFNSDQVDGWQPPGAPVREDLTTRLAHVDEFIAHTKADIRYGGQRAFYRHPRENAEALKNGDSDFIQIPDRDRFTGTATSSPTECFEATRLHELIHWSGARNRLNRDFGKRFGDEAYAFEELIAEIGSAALCAHLAITNDPRLDHAQYIDHWLTILKSDAKAIFTAASQGSKAVDYLFNLQPAQPALADNEETDLAD